MYGRFLRSVRSSRGLTQAGLSEIVGIAVPNLSAYENDRQMPSIDTLNRIVVACGYQLKAVAGDEVIELPLAKGGWTPLEWIPGREFDDPEETGRPMPFDAPMGERVQAIREILDFPIAVAGER